MKDTANKPAAEVDPEVRPRSGQNKLCLRGAREGVKVHGWKVKFTGMGVRIHGVPGGGGFGENGPFGSSSEPKPSAARPAGDGVSATAGRV